MLNKQPSQVARLLVFKGAYLKKTNYMIATWSGSGFGRTPSDLTIKKHIDNLNTLSHNISQVSIGYPHNPDETKEYKNYIEKLKELDDGTPIVVYPIDNKGMSYGQYSKIFDKCRNKFDYYIFMEDDYVPCVNKFDTKLIDMFNEETNCGLLCSLFVKPGDNYNNRKSNFEPHAAISNGISSCEVLKNIWEKYGTLFYSENTYLNGQKKWSEMFIKTGYKITDYLHKYKSLYFQHNNTARLYYDGIHHEDIIVPIQFLGKNDYDSQKYIRKNNKITME